MTFPDRNSANSWRSLALLALVLLVAGIGRVRETDHPLSFDEIWLLAGSVGQGQRLQVLSVTANQMQENDAPLTSLEGTQPLSSIWKQPVPFHPPLHIATLRLWRELWGGSDRVASMLSACCSVLTIGLAFLALRQQVGDRFATLTCLIMGLSPLQIQLGTEVRGYALAIAWTSFAVWLMVRIEKSGPTLAAVYLLGLTTLPLMMTHYFAVGNCFAILLWGCLRLPRPYRLHLLASLLLAGLLFGLTWGPYFMGNVDRDGTSFLLSDDPFWRRSLVYATDLPMRLLVHSQNRPLSACVSLALLTLVAMQVWRRDAEVLPWALMLLLPLALLLFMDGIKSTKLTSFTRYFAMASIGMPTASLVAAFRWRPKVAWAIGFALLGWVLLNFGTPRDIGSYYTYPAKQAFVPSIAAGPPQRPIVFWWAKSDSASFVPHSLYLEMLHAGLQSHPTMVLKSDRFDALRVQRALREACRDDRFWLIVPRPLAKDGQLPAELRARLPGTEVEGQPVSVPRGPGYLSPRPAATLWLLRFSNDKAE